MQKIKNKKEKKMTIAIFPHPTQFNDDYNFDIRYQNWLRNDHPRELAYRLALEDIRKNYPKCRKILDAGTGSGVWAITTATIFKNALVLGIDMHEKNIQLAEENAKGFPMLKNRLNFKIKNILKLDTKKKFDLIITELEGGVGNNENAKKYFNKLQGLLSPRGIILPLVITIFTVPVELPKDVNTNDSDATMISSLDYRKLNINNSFSNYYVVYGATSDLFLSKFMILDDIYTMKPIREGYEKKLEFIVTRSGTLSGFLVWFTQSLTKNVKLNSHPDELTTTWGNAYFPIKETRVEKDDRIELIFNEVIANSYSIPYYIWKVSKNKIPIGKYSNEDIIKKRCAE